MLFILLLRTQFNFSTDPTTLDNILNEIANQHVSITAFLLNQNKSCLDVKLVVGLPDSLANDCAWNTIVSSILRSNNVKFHTKEIVQAIGSESGVPGIIAKLYTALYKVVTIYTIYIGENTNLFIDSNNNCKVLQNLSKL
jgi:hypothetical protein